MKRTVAFRILDNSIYVEAKLEDLGGQRVRVLGFYLDGKRCIPAMGIRQEVERGLARALQTEWNGKYELVDVSPSVEEEEI